MRRKQYDRTTDQRDRRFFALDAQGWETVDIPGVYDIRAEAISKKGFKRPCTLRLDVSWQTHQVTVIAVKYDGNVKAPDPNPMATPNPDNPFVVDFTHVEDA